MTLAIGTDRPEPRTVARSLPAEIDLQWRASGVPGYHPIESWLELDLLLGRVGDEGFDFLVVESRARGRFAQTMGESNALIIEICDEAGVHHPTIWRLRRPPGDRLPHADLGVLVWEGGITAESLFTVNEARLFFREFLLGGSVHGLGCDPVSY